MHNFLEAILITPNNSIIDILLELDIDMLDANARQEREGLEDLRNEHLQYGLPVQEREVAQLRPDTHNRVLEHYFRVDEVLVG